MDIESLCPLRQEGVEKMAGGSGWISERECHPSAERLQLRSAAGAGKSLCDGLKAVGWYIA